MIPIIGRAVLTALMTGSPSTGPAPVDDIPPQNYDCTLSIAGKDQPTAVFHTGGILVIVVGVMPRGFIDKSGAGYLESFSNDVLEDGKEKTYIYSIEALDLQMRAQLQQAFVKLVSTVAEAIRQNACMQVRHH